MLNNAQFLKVCKRPDLATSISNRFMDFNQHTFTNWEFLKSVIWYVVNT